MCVLLVCTAPLAAAADQPLPSDEDISINALVQSIELAVSTVDPARWEALLSPNASREAAREFFATTVPPEVTRVVLRERDRFPLDGALPGDGYSVIADVFIESGTRGRIFTWRLDIRKPRDSTEPQPWRIIGHETLSSIEGLHRLSLTSDQQFTARDLVVRSVDLELRMASADVFVAETTDGVTGVVMLGNGTMAFTPGPSEERGQVRIFAGTDSIQTPITHAYLRFNPFEFETQIRDQLRAAEGVDARQLRRAQQVFDDESGKSYSLDLRDLSREPWTLLPQMGDFLAEIRTRRHGTLTFARATNEAEDVSLFHRDRQRNIAAYASEMKLSTRGRFFNEDDLVEYDVLDYWLDAGFSPSRQWLEGHARLKIRVKAYALAALTLRLADDFTVTSVSSDVAGRLMFLRVRNQNNVVINLPTPLPRDAEMTLTVAYSGPISTQGIDQESLTVGQVGRPTQRADDLPFIPPEPNWLFSNRSHWYPQNQVTDYATATVRFSVPGEYTVVASGVEVVESPLRTFPPSLPSGEGQLTYIFRATEPVRYIGALISRFTRVDRAAVALEVSGPGTTVTLAVDANRRQQDRGREVFDSAVEIVQLYASLVDGAPYDALTIAMVEDERPGGHSPPYFAILNNPTPLSPFRPRQDPAAFTSFPEFYLAHEIAHQWWGQGVGWKNYHEQWLSEGISQYFAALYAQQRRGDTVFRDVIRQFRRWAMDQSDQGAVYLGYRLGHIKNDSRVFRAIAYNKGAAVLHMLRRLIGDDAFFRGLRQYYTANRFQKAGSQDLQHAMEVAAGRPLERFFERWIYSSGLPRLRYQTSTSGGELVVSFEQVGELVYDVPVTVTLNYGDRTVDVIVPVTEAVVERRLPLEGALRGVEINADHAALADFDRR